MNDITPGDAKDFERWLGTKAARENAHGENTSDTGLAPNTVRKRISNSKQFFADAVSRELLRRNPFQSLKSNTGGNRKRDYFLTRADAYNILEACPDAQWRLIFALRRPAVSLGASGAAMG
ncbi:MAG: phage integrase SAM-like domain-containing protein [Pirellulales bacterium]